MANWKITQIKKLKLNNPILIVGLPGIGNVGKIAVDIITEQLKAERMFSFFSCCLPNSVFVKEDNTVELPKIEMLHKAIGKVQKGSGKVHKASGKGKAKQDFLFLVGDVQPMKEEDSYSFAQAVLDVAKKHGCKEIITLGGIGLQEPPKNPKLFCTGNDAKLIKEFTKLGASDKLFGVVGPIMGITGLLLGLGRSENMAAAALLVETYGHPMHVGLSEAKELMAALEKKYSLGINLKQIDKDINKLENELKPLARQKELEQEAHKDPAFHQDTSYIG
ncbi:PAC2 family protein [Candidatus Woesearchaeota archaeon]|nr:PAC2 family protein [Candidatus Woesearchaeota archaeon]